jgi:para-nitrobenzyl esterase
VGEKVGTQLGDAAGAHSIAELRALSPAQIDAAMAKLPGGPMAGLRFAPIVDGLMFPDAAAVGGNASDVPVLTGMTETEMNGLNPAYGKATPASISGQLGQRYGAMAGDFAKAYPATDDAQANAAADAIARDRGLASMFVWARTRLAHSRAPIFAYLWTHAEPGPEATRYKAFHSSEIPYVFATLDASPERPFTAEDRALSAMMSGYWINWVKNGDPNSTGLPEWPKLTSAEPRILEIGGATHARPLLAPELMALYDRYVATGGTLSLF